MPKLYVLCGVPACGKSYFAEQFMRDNADSDIRYVSRDEIRFSLVKEEEDYFCHEKEVFKKFAGTIAATLVDGFDVIADATHLNYWSRKKLINAIDEITTDYTICFVCFETPLDICLNRNAGREGRARVPDEIMYRMSKNYTLPTFSELNDSRVTMIWHIKGYSSYGNIDII